VLDPVTGELLSEGLNLFSVTGQPPAESETPEAVVIPPRLEIVLAKTNYTAGEPVVVMRFALSNATATAAAVELKVWTGTPNERARSTVNGGADGSFVLPAGFAQDFGPMILFTVPLNAPLGEYEFSGRLVDPVTGKLCSEALGPFTIR